MMLSPNVGYSFPDVAETVKKTNLAVTVDQPVADLYTVAVCDQMDAFAGSHFINHFELGRPIYLASTANLLKGIDSVHAVPEKSYKCTIIRKSGEIYYILKYPPKIRRC